VVSPPQPLRPAAPGTGQNVRPPWLVWSLDHWPLLATALVIILLIATGIGVYAYASSLAAQPTKLVAKYCAALTGDDATGAYGLLSPELQSQTSLKQYKQDTSDRDAISGKVTACGATPTQHLNALSFLSNPRSLLFSMTLARARGSSAKGQLALTRDASGWHIAGYSTNLAGIDLGPLHTEEALCQAFLNKDYKAAYALLSAPYQTEQGSEAAFAKAFGATLAITGCEPTLKGYTVDSADQHASFQITLDVAVSGGGSATKFTVPAVVALAREQAGWRVDSITPTLNQ
jgi:hypothetical protein